MPGPRGGQWGRQSSPPRTRRNWASADLTEVAVTSIRDLVETDVHLTDGRQLPFGDREFDVVVVVDMLEHVAGEATFVAELGRVLRPGGLLVINTPHQKSTLLRRLRHALGQTDEKHGHLRQGYTGASLRGVLAGRFRLERSRTYSKFFSELVDALLNWAWSEWAREAPPRHGGHSGRPRAPSEALRVYSLVYPLVWLVARLDLLVPASGYMLIARARRL